VGRVVRDLVYEEDGVKRADLVVNLTNSAWYVGRTMQPQHIQIATFRAIENRVPVARAVNGGISGFVDSSGRIGPVIDRGAGVAAARLTLDPRVTVFGRVGTIPVTGLALATGALILAALRPRRIRAES